jgi:vacuole morphology and inheritance protein 14
MDLDRVFISCRRYLSDPTEDVRVSTENLLAEFLREVRDIAIAQKRREEKLKGQQKESLANSEKGADGRMQDPEKEKLPDITVVVPEKGNFITGDDASAHDTEHGETDTGDDHDPQDRDTGGMWHT